MDGSRRKFLRVAGLSVLGCASVRLGAQDESSPAAAIELPTPGAPLTAHRWAMVVDLRKFEEHRSWDRCIEACHRVHNVPEFDNPKDEVKWIWTEGFEHAFPDLEHEHAPEAHANLPILVLCNHCDNPPCTRVCPTQATWKRESDGIVMMDWHRCIGCRYCVVACPYGSRSFNWRDPRQAVTEPDPNYPTRMRGVVEKCTFCEERLARGIPPACVEACEHGELVFGDLEDPDSEVRRLLAEHFTIRRKPSLGTQPEVYYIV
jgi:molybdopterin-containing oxidoreductase family iron-sulfur binding subunit